MNDNISPADILNQKILRLDRIRLDTIVELRERAVRGVTRPESLTLVEIQEIAWAFLIQSTQKR